MHVVGNSYGAIVTLTLATERPDLIATAAVHEPPLFGLLEGTRDQTLARELSARTQLHCRDRPVRAAGAAARVEVPEGAGHIPHATHPEDWTARLVGYHDRQAHARQQRWS